MVTFETKCWEKDWEILLKTDRLASSIANNCYNFAEKILYINNVNNVKTVTHYADKAVATGIIDKYIIVNDYAQKALDFFEIDINSFAGGYYYSIQELVGIYLCQTKYLLHFSSDSMLANKHDWINSVIETMNHTNKIKVANPIWNEKYQEAKDGAIYEEKNFYVGYGFSDQCYLISVTDFKKPIYNEKNAASEIYYPIYGGELFEKRVDSWMRNNGVLRATYKNTSYIHKNFF